MSEESKSFIVKSAVKDQIHSLGFRISDEALDFLSVKIGVQLEEAAKRAQQNGRQTIKPCDL